MKLAQRIYTAWCDESGEVTNWSGLTTEETRKWERVGRSVSLSILDDANADILPGPDVEVLVDYTDLTLEDI